MGRDTGTYWSPLWKDRLETQSSSFLILLFSTAQGLRFPCVMQQLLPGLST